MTGEIGGIGGPKKLHLEGFKAKSNQGQHCDTANYPQTINSLGASYQHYHPNRPLQKGINWNNLFNSNQNVHIVKDTSTANNASINQIGDYRGVNIVADQTSGNNSKINQEIFSYDELGQVAKTSGRASDIQLTGQSKSNLVQIADTQNGNITLNGTSNLGAVVQDAYTAGGNIDMNATSELGANMNATSNAGSVNQNSTWGDNTMNIEAHGNDNKYIQKSEGGNDELAMNIHGSNNHSAQISGHNYDINTYDVTGNGNRHEMILGNDEDSGYVTMYPDSSNNQIIMRGGDRNIDNANDTYHVTLGGQNNLVAVNPGIQPTRSNRDQLYVNTDYAAGKLNLSQSSDSNFAYVLSDGSNQIGIGPSVTQLFIDNQPVKLY